MAIKGIPPALRRVGCSPSPARDICFVFCAFADPGADRATTGRKGHKQHQKNCANLCTIVQTFSKKIPPKRDFSSQRFLSSFHSIRKH
jgi:hypothetical protein